MIALLKHHGIEASDIVGFVLERRNKNGGFSASPGIPADIQDTYYALKVLNSFSSITSERLNYHPSKDYPLKKYLSGATLNNNIKPKILYFYIKSCEMVNINICAEKFYYLLSSCELEDQFYLSKIFNKHLIPVKKWGTIKELSMYLHLNPNINKSEKHKLIHWIYSCQNPDGGFGFLPNSTSFVENTYFALKAISYLKESTDIQDVSIRRALNFILSCYTGKGGFARKDGGAPLLEATYYSVSALLLITTP